MLRKIIEIDETACNGCGLCVAACHEGAIGLVEGKARLLRDDYCDGLGDCLPACPTCAISFVEREAAAYDEAAVKARTAQENSVARLSGGCPGSLSRFFASEDPEAKPARPSASAPVAEPVCEETPSQLSQWPVEIKLAPVQAPYFAGAHVLIAADCTAFAYADFHRGFMRGRITLIGCPKLDGAHGGAVLRRPGTCGARRARAQRQERAVRGGGDLDEGRAAGAPLASEAAIRRGTRSAEDLPPTQPSVQMFHVKYLFGQAPSPSAVMVCGLSFVARERSFVRRGLTASEARVHTGRKALRFCRGRDAYPRTKGSNMETIEELFRKVLDDEDLRASFGQALEGDRLEVFLRENGCEAAPSEVREALEGMFREELGDELLDEVNGGMAKYRLYLHEPFLKTTSAASQKIKIIKG